VGNRLTSADVSGSWSYNANNELLGYADVKYEYDENGNMISRTTRIWYKQRFEENDKN
jgi:YD repeat-containing protein